MDDAQYDAEMRTQNDYLRSQLLALAKKDRKIRLRFINHEIRCAGCGDIVIQVVALDPYRVIRYRRTELELDEQILPADVLPVDRARMMADRKRSIRLDSEWSFTPIPDEPDTRVRQLVFAACRCTGRHTFTVAGILARAGNKSTAKPAH